MDEFTGAVASMCIFIGLLFILGSLSFHVDVIIAMVQYIFTSSSILFIVGIILTGIGLHLIYKW